MGVSLPFAYNAVIVRVALLAPLKEQCVLLSLQKTQVYLPRASACGDGRPLWESSSSLRPHLSSCRAAPDHRTPDLKDAADWIHQHV